MTTLPTACSSKVVKWSLSNRLAKSEKEAFIPLPQRRVVSLSDALSASSCGEEELISDLRNRLVALLQLCESLTKLKLSPTPKLIMWLKDQVRNRLKCFSVCSELFAKKEATATFHLLSFYLQPSRRYSDYQHERHVSVGRSHLELGVNRWVCLQFSVTSLIFRC